MTEQFVPDHNFRGDLGKEKESDDAGGTSGYSCRRNGACGCEVRDSDGIVVAWAANEV